MEHLFNCHGEWLLAIGVLMDPPLLRAWVRVTLARLLKRS